MSKSRRVSRKPFFVILALSLVLAISYTVWNTYFRPTPVSIMAITPTTLSYGDTTISGTLQKDAPADLPGTFFLTLPDMRVVLLYNVQGVDALLGQSVSVAGLLSPAMTSSIPMSMTVKSITVAQ